MSRIEQTEIHELAKKMSEAISNEIQRRVIADERKLEEVLKANGWRKASEVMREIADFIWEKDIADTLLPINGRYLSKQDFIDYFEKKYTEGGKEKK